MTNFTLVEIAEIVNFVIQAEGEMSEAIEPCASVLFNENEEWFMLGIVINTIAAFVISYLIIGGVVFVVLVIIMLFRSPQSGNSPHSIKEAK